MKLFSERKKTVKRKIYEHIKNKGPVTATSIAKNLDLLGIDVLRIVEGLAGEGFVKRCPPLPLDTKNDVSCLYVATKKEYDFRKEM